MTSEFAGSHTDPIIDISKDELFNVAKSVKMNDDSWLEAMNLLDDTHPTLHLLIQGSALRLSGVSEIGPGDPPATLYFRKGAYTAYLLLQRVSEQSLAPLHQEINTGDLMQDIESNYKISEADRELKTQILSGVEQDGLDSLADYSLRTLLGLEEFSHRYPQYYAACIKFGARFIRRLPTFVEENLNQIPAEEIHRALGKETILQMLPDSETRTDMYAFSLFAYGFAGLSSMLLEARQSEVFRQQFEGGV